MASVYGAYDPFLKYFSLKMMMNLRKIYWLTCCSGENTVNELANAIYIYIYS